MTKRTENYFGTNSEPHIFRTEGTNKIETKLMLFIVFILNNYPSLTPNQSFVSMIINEFSTQLLLIFHFKY